MRGKSKINYSMGTVFLVPVRGGGYARGVVARLNGKGGIFGYFFGPKLSSKEEAKTTELLPREAVLVGDFGDISLLSGEWVQLGRAKDWNADAWPMLPLIRVDESTNKAFLSYYDERTFEFIREEEVSSTLLDRYPYDRTMGAGAVEIRLSKLLNQ